MSCIIPTLLSLVGVVLATNSQILESGLKIDYLTVPKGCENPVKTYDIVRIDYEGKDQTISLHNNLMMNYLKDTWRTVLICLWCRELRTSSRSE